MTEKEKIVVTVMGQDRVGIVAGISNVLAEKNVNIIDLTSTKMRGLFVMSAPARHSRRDNITNNTG